jgi:hypothetical protein
VEVLVEKMDEVASWLVDDFELDVESVVEEVPDAGLVKAFDAEPVCTGVVEKGGLDVTGFVPLGVFEGEVVDPVVGLAVALAGVAPAGPELDAAAVAAMLESPPLDFAAPTSDNAPESAEMFSP